MFVDCVENQRPFPITPEQAIHNLRICEEIQAGLEQGGCAV
jgi:hypothetical protein